MLRGDGLRERRACPSVRNPGALTAHRSSHPWPAPVARLLRMESLPAPQPAWQSQDPGLAFFAGLVVVNATLGASVAHTRAHRDP